jgi:glucose/arabinose dehydrogenase
MRRRALALSAVLILAPAWAPCLEFKPVPSDRHFKQPVAAVADPAAPKLLYVVEQAGQVWALEAGHASLFLDLRPKVRLSSEEGLLCLAFHPGSKTPAKAPYYAIYSVKGAKPRRTRLSEFRGASKTERVLLEVTKRWSNHNGSTLAFGPDGFLYVSLGDGGSGGDPDGNAQNLKSPLGKVLRIDVDHQDPGLAYAIPKDNPWAGRADVRPEIWAYGLRNPWRMAFDSASGALWAGDVGQDAREEVDLIVKGGNYGWNWREGKQAYKEGAGAGPFVEPVLDYGRDQGFCITGGPVARGAAPPSLLGRYLYADFGTRTLWSLDSSTKNAQPRKEGTCPDAPSSFGTDPEGHVYVVGYDGGLYRLEETKEQP